LPGGYALRGNDGEASERAPCQQGRSWGYNDRGIWVDPRLQGGVLR